MSKYRCPNCGAKLRYGVGTGMLYCKNCGFVVSKKDYKNVEQPVQVKQTVQVKQPEPKRDHVSIFDRLKKIIFGGGR